MAIATTDRPLQSSGPGAAPPRRWPKAAARALGTVPPPLLVLFAILSIQLGAALAIDLFATFGPVGTAFLRIAISAGLLLALSRPKLDGSLREHAGLILFYGLALAVMNSCFYMAIARIPLGIAVTIEFIGPLGVAVATSRRPRDLVWVGLALAGVAVLSPEIGGDLDPLGVLYAAIAGACWAAFVLLSIRVGRAFEGGSGLALGMTVATLALLPFAWTSVGTLLAEPGLVILVTAVATIVGALLLGDGLSWRSLLAVACVVLASIGVTLFDKR